MTDRYGDRPFPDDNDGRDDYGRDHHARGHAAPRPPQGSTQSDPLAELARLIGQTDPFSSFAREHQQQRPSRDAYDAQDAQYDSLHDGRYTDQQHGGYQDQQESSSDDGQNTPAWMRRLATPQQTPFQADDFSAVGREPYDTYGATPRRYEQPRFDPVPAADPRAVRAPDPARYEDVLYGKPEPQPPQDDTRYQAPQDDYRDDPFARADYEMDEAEQRPRRGGRMTVIAVLLLAVAGTGAAFGYRTIFGSPRSGEPPVIKADAGPNKVVPAGSGSNKQIVDRVGEKGGERVVSREEQPIDVNAKAQPRVVFPPLTQNSNPPTATSASTTTRPTGAGVGNGTLGGDEPRKIRTLAIRPDGASDVVPTSAAAPAAAPPPMQRQAPAPVARAPAPVATASTPAPSSNGGPMSLSPQGAPAAAPNRVASISPATSNGGGSYVQVSSQKTEADAQASYRALQSKYSDMLGSRQAAIRRADLGEKGVFYRALVGPFGNAEEATQFCVNLKSAGGQCIVQR